MHKVGENVFKAGEKMLRRERVSLFEDRLCLKLWSGKVCMRWERACLRWERVCLRQGEEYV